MLKRKTALFMSLLMTASLFAGCSKSTSGSASEGGDLKIGVIMPLTGDVSTFGQSSKNALDILQEEVNAKGGVLGKKLKLVYEDDENKPATSANVAQKLINNDKVVAIIGSLTSKCTLAAAPIAQQAKIPMITGASTNAKVTQTGDFIFRACFIDPFQGNVVSKFATEDLKAKTAAILFDNGNDYSKGLTEVFQANFKKLGGSVVATESYNTGDQDFNAQLTKVKGLNPDVIFLPDYYGTVGLITKQARQLGIKATFLGVDGWDSPDLAKIAGDSINGSYFSNHYSPDDTSKEVQDFRKKYEEKYKVTPDALGVLAYDAGQILINAISKAGKTDGKSIQEAMKQTDLQGVTGHIKFDENRDSVKSAVMIKMVDGKQTFGKKVNP